MTREDVIYYLDKREEQGYHTGGSGESSSCYTALNPPIFTGDTSVHLPQVKPVRVDLDRLAEGKKKVHWFNPATGKYTRVKNKSTKGAQSFVPPSTDQQDWVLVVNVGALHLNQSQTDYVINQ